MANEPISKASIGISHLSPDATYSTLEYDSQGKSLMRNSHGYVNHYNITPMTGKDPVITTGKDVTPRKRTASTHKVYDAISETDGLLRQVCHLSNQGMNPEGSNTTVPDHGAVLAALMEQFNVMKDKMEAQIAQNEVQHAQIEYERVQRENQQAIFEAHNAQQQEEIMSLRKKCNSKATTTFNDNDIPIVDEYESGNNPSNNEVIRHMSPINFENIHDKINPITIEPVDEFEVEDLSKKSNSPLRNDIPPSTYIEPNSPLKGSNTPQLIYNSPISKIPSPSSNKVAINEPSMQDMFASLTTKLDNDKLTPDI